MLHRLHWEVPEELGIFNPFAFGVTWQKGQVLQTIGIGSSKIDIR